MKKFGHKIDIDTGYCVLCGFAASDIFANEIYCIKQERKGKIMKTRTELRNMVAMIADDVVTIDCCFSKYGQKTYKYKATKSFVASLEKDDLVIVATKDDNKLGFSVVRFVAADDFCDMENIETIEYLWAIQKVDNALYEKLIAEEDVLTDRLDKVQRKNMKDKMVEALLGSSEDVKALGTFTIEKGE